jgi:hypothetical protein
MSRVSRRIASTPERTAVETWQRISALLAPDAKSANRAELDRVASVAAAAISSEGPKEDPIIIHGGGPRAHIYCVYGEDAVNKDGVEEDPFSRTPMEGDWKLSLPVPPEDLGWTQKKLQATSSRVTARALGEKLGEDEKASAHAGGGIEVDVKEFLQS